MRRPPTARPLYRASTTPTTAKNPRRQRLRRRKGDDRRGDDSLERARCAMCIVFSLSRAVSSVRNRRRRVVECGTRAASCSTLQLGHVASFDISMDKQCIDESRHSRDASMSRRGLGRTRVAPLVDARVTRRESSRDGDGVEEIFATHRATFRSDAARPSRVAGAQDARVAVVASRSTPRASLRARASLASDAARAKRARPNSDKKVRRFARRRGFVARATVDSIDGWMSRQMTRLGSLGSLGHPRGGGVGRLFGRRRLGRDD